MLTFLCHIVPTCVINLGMENNIMSELEAIQIYSKNDWLDKMFRKSESEGTKLMAQTALNVFEDFCNYQKKTESQLIRELQMLSKAGEIRKLCLFLDRFVQFMNQDHPDITRLDPFRKKNLISFKRKGPKTIKSYFGFIKSYLRLCHDVKITSEDVKDYITFPKIRKEPRKAVTIEILKRIFHEASPQRRALYNVLVSSGMRLGEALQLTKNDIHLDENPVRVTIRAETTKTKEGRESYISSEAIDKLKPVIENIEDEDRIFVEEKYLKRFKSIKLAVAHEDHIFSRLRERLSQKDKRFKEKYPNSYLFVVNIHSFRAYFHTKASEKHGVEYANALDGHSGYLSQYYRKSPQERAKMYLELEPSLLIESIKPEVEKTKDRIIDELQDKMQKLQDKMTRLELLSK